MLRRLALIAFAGSLALVAAAPASARTSIVCTGDATLVPDASSIQVRQLGPLTVTSFDFGGAHSMCTRAGDRVEGTWSGHAVQTVLPNGTTLLAVRGHEQFEGATLDVAALLRISPSGRWTVLHGRAFNGTGWLDGATSRILEVSPLSPSLIGFRSILTWG